MIERPGGSQVKEATESATGEEMSEDEKNDVRVSSEDERISESEREREKKVQRKLMKERRKAPSQGSLSRWSTWYGFILGINSSAEILDVSMNDMLKSTGVL
ncbi:hypothetical protein ILYODFUR_035268 [Ilyodon furcidens]|uniref:Uncharacterized protein n=1 Tax=Ilyodon furcidens TaxID=33524 RepID=A0ABV0UAZ1_9TELE